MVTPDNGTLTHVKNRIGVEEVRVIDETRNRLKSTEKCNIFHGRDLFAYCAGKLASGMITYEEVGPEYPVDEIVVHEMVPCRVEGNRISGMIGSSDDHFGLICSNIPAEVFEEEHVNYGDVLSVKIMKKGLEKPVFEGKVPFCRAFGDVEEGKPLLMVSETLDIQIAINLRNMSKEYGIEAGSDWTIEFEK